MELNGLHVEAVAALLEALDRMVNDKGTHLSGPTEFVVYDDNAEEQHVVVGYREGAHVLIV